MIRKAKIEDSNSIANLILRGWQTAYKGLIDQELLDDMKEDEMSKGWKKNIFSQNESNNIYVYEEENRILGVIRFGKVDDKNDRCHNAEIYVLYVEPELKRNGIGSKLFNYAKAYFIEHNTTDLIIWCLKENEPSIEFYKKMGGKIIGESINPYEYQKIRQWVNELINSIYSYKNSVLGILDVISTDYKDLDLVKSIYIQSNCIC